MKNSLQHVALRNKAIYLPDNQLTHELTGGAAAILIKLADRGYSLSEDALNAVNSLNIKELEELIKVLDDVYGLDLSWTSLTKDWLIPTGTTMADRFVTAVYNLFPEYRGEGTTLPCGHFIPAGVFDLSRYNGCPFCGKVFEHRQGTNTGGHGRMTVLSRMTDADMIAMRDELIASPVPLDATQADTLATLVMHYGMPDKIHPAIHETTKILSAALYDNGDRKRAVDMLKTPDDIIGMLWFRQSKNIRFKTPKELISATESSYRFHSPERAVAELRAGLKLHFSRPECELFARRINSLPMSAGQICADMHHRRSMWVRFIRALRLSEYSRRKKLEKLSEILHRFASGEYTVYNGEVEKTYIHRDADECLAMLSERPGYFARCLFSAMLALGTEKSTRAFAAVADKVPLRLLYSLASNAELYFLPNSDMRTIVIPGSSSVSIPVNHMLKDYSLEERQAMSMQVKNLVLRCFARVYARMTHGGSMYIAPELFDIPAPVSDRSTSVQDSSAALQGQKFAFDGNKVRLFLHWGQGLPAQHLDMDLSAIVLYADGSRRECAYYSLDFPGAIHSGDIQQIPDNIGAAEYVELDIPTLANTGAKYIIFTGNMYTDGGISANTIFGWMDSKFPMQVDKESGVAYDPADVQHFIRLSGANNSKGIVFGVLDIGNKEITWLEMPLRSQRADEADGQTVLNYMRRLRNKISIGELLKTQAESRQMQIVDLPEDAIEVYNPTHLPSPSMLLGQ